VNPKPHSPNGERQPRWLRRLVRHQIAHNNLKPKERKPDGSALARRTKPARALLKTVQNVCDFLKPKSHLKSTIKSSATAWCLTVSRQLGIQPILWRVQSILFHGTVVKRAELVVQHKIAPFMTFNRAKAFICRANSTCSKILPIANRRYFG
jgi:hypothetical protein